MAISTQKILNKNELLPELESLKELLINSIGPSGSSVLLQNAVKGPVTLSGSASTILQRYSSKNPFVSLVKAAVSSQTQAHSDGGCFTGLMICLIIKGFLNVDCHPKLYSNMLTWCNEQIVSIMETNVHKQLVIDTEAIIGQIKCILNSKLLRFLNSTEILIITRGLAEVFIMTGGVVQDAALSFIHQRTMDFTIKLFPGIMLDGHHSVLLLPEGRYKTVLFTCSLSGDTEELDSVTYTGSDTGVISRVILDRIISLCDNLCVKQGVQLIVCQKVIHPQVKLLLHKKHVNYLERLGSMKMRQFQYLSGVKVISSITDNSQSLEIVDIICSHTTLSSNDDIWLQLQSVENQYYSSCVGIGFWNQEIGHEIESTCRQALQVLQRLIHDPRLLPGKGRWQLWLANRIENQFSVITAEEIKKIGATTSSFRALVESFTQTLKVIGNKLDLESEGLSPDQTFDSYTSQMNALQTALAVAKSVIMTGTIIKSQ